jgi:hypothetical protein
MLPALRRHPIPIAAHFRHSLVLTYAFPRGLLAPLLPPALELDTLSAHGFAAVALVQTDALRPAFAPRALGRSVFLAGYRLFVRLAEAPSLRGLFILRSDTDKRTMALFGNLLTHYRYRKADVSFSGGGRRLEIEVRTPRAEADLHVVADLRSRPAPLPPDSPFGSIREARRFAGPLPYTFHHEEETGSIVAVRGVRSAWDPQAVAVEVARATFFERSPFAGQRLVLANAFHVADVDYRWERGQLIPASGPGAPSSEPA